MAKTHAPDVDLAKARAVVTERNPLDVLGSCFEGFEELRKAHKISTPFIALEALGAILGARTQGHSDAEIRRIWPEAWGEDSVQVPAALLSALRDAWLSYQNAPAGTTLGEAFNVEGGGQGRQIMNDALKSHRKSKDLAIKVEVEYVAASISAEPSNLENSNKAVAKREGVSYETAKKAHSAHRDSLRTAMVRHGLLKD
jgi:hypothetical protein